MKLTENSRKILQALMKNPKNSDRLVALKAEVSQPTVSRTRVKLEEAGIIKGYSVIPDLAKLGYEVLAITEIKLNETMLKVQEALIEDPRAIFVMKNYGYFYVVSRHTTFTDLMNFLGGFRVERTRQTTTEKGIIKDFAIREL